VYRTTVNHAKRDKQKRALLTAADQMQAQDGVKHTTAHHRDRCCIAHSFLFRLHMNLRVIEGLWRLSKEQFGPQRARVARERARIVGCCMY